MILSHFQNVVGQEAITAAAAQSDPVVPRSFRSSSEANPRGLRSTFAPGDPASSGSRNPSQMHMGALKFEPHEYEGFETRANRFFLNRNSSETLKLQRNEPHACGCVEIQTK